MVISDFQSLLIFFILVIIIFRNRITKIWLNHPSLGEWLIEIDNKKHILSHDSRNLLKNLPDTYLWALLDFRKKDIHLKNGFLITSLNPLQKLIYKNMIPMGLVKKGNSEIILTEKGEEITRLLGEVDI